MGKVYSWPEVHGSQVPEPEVFPKVLAQVSERMKREPSIIAATAFGSVTRGDFNRRSDLDVAVVYDEEREFEAITCMNALARSAKKLYVPLHFVPCSHQLAGSTMHFFGPGFLRHIKRSENAGGCLTQPYHPSEYFARGLTQGDELYGYLRNKLHKLVTAQAHFAALDPAQQMHFLTKLLEAPINAIRKVLAYYGELGEDDSKRAVLNAYRAWASEEAGEKLRLLVKLDQTHSRILEEQLAAPDKRRYLAHLEFLRSQAPRIIDFVRNIALTY